MPDQHAINIFVMGQLQILAEKNNIEGFSAEMNLLEAGVLDSLGLLELVSGIEAEFGVDVEFFRIEPEEFETASGVASGLARVAS